MLCGIVVMKSLHSVTSLKVLAVQGIAFLTVTAVTTSNLAKRQQNFFPLFVSSFLHSYFYLSSVSCIYSPFYLFLRMSLI
jgi:uncharacterized membrane protein